MSKHRLSPLFPVKKLVLLGGGHSHLFVLKEFGMRPIEGLQLTLVTRDIHTPYSGMLPGYLAGFYTFNDCHVDLAKLAAFAGVQLVHAACCGLDTAQQVLKFEDRPPLQYDCLSINLGVTPRMRDTPGWECVTPVKPINSFVTRVDNLLRRVGATSEHTSVVVVGGGAGGVEIAFAMHHRLLGSAAPPQGGSSPAAGAAVESGSSSPGAPHFSVTLVTQGTILRGYPQRARQLVLEAAGAKGITILEHAEVTRIEAGSLHTRTAGCVSFDECLWCTGAAPAEWLRSTSLPKVDEGGFLAINEFLQSAGGPCNVFAAGDVATSVVDPRPKAGVFAVRQGAPLAHNLKQYLLGKPLQPFHPQRTWLSLITTGDKAAIATKAGFAFGGGSWMWRFKDYIDRAFMAKFSSDLPSMAPTAGAAVPDVLHDADEATQEAWRHAAMPCRGCAAKVGPATLQEMLAALVEPAAAGACAVDRAGTSSDAAGQPPAPGPPTHSVQDCARVPAAPEGHVQVQTVDFINACTGDLYLFGRIAANHALADCYAAGASPSAALALAQVARAAPHIVNADLKQMMLGARGELATAGAPLIGGHSCLGSETGLGLAITGTAWPEALMAKAHLRAGHALVVTKAIGTGVVLRGAMLAASEGRWLRGAWDSMLQSNAPASRIFVEHGVRACTDISGFGMLGHLAEMAEASGVQVHLDPASVPLLPGVLELVAGGTTSTAERPNSHVLHKIDDHNDVAATALGHALLDPQTSGEAGAAPAPPKESTGPHRCVSCGSVVPNEAAFRSCHAELVVSVLWLLCLRGRCGELAGQSRLVSRAGPLVAGVDKVHVQDVLCKLRGAGFHRACVIGTCRDLSEQTALIVM